MPRFRFSLRSFFLFLFFACLIGSNLFTAREVNRLNEKLSESHRTIEKLQIQVGELVIIDPAKLYAVAIPSYDTLTWRWRLHVPSQTKYGIRLTTHEVSENGIPPNGESLSLPGGDHEFTAAVRKDRNGEWAINMIFTQQTPTGAVGSSQQNTLAVAPDRLQWAAHESGSTSRQAGSNGTESMTPGEPMVLLRHRIMRGLDGGSRSTVPEPCDGVMIWIVEEEQVP
jgi:hypothetical protein